MTLQVELGQLRVGQPVHHRARLQVLGHGANALVVGVHEAVVVGLAADDEDQRNVLSHRFQRGLDDGHLETQDLNGAVSQVLSPHHVHLTLGAAVAVDDEALGETTVLLHPRQNTLDERTELVIVRLRGALLEEVVAGEGARVLQVVGAVLQVGQVPDGSALPRSRWGCRRCRRAGCEW